jgi:hypothetical protein
VTDTAYGVLVATKHMTTEVALVELLIYAVASK